MSYDPYNDGWYLLPIKQPIGVTGPVAGLTPAQLSTINSHTIQGLIETVYVRVGNDILYQGLNGLDKAISTTSQTLSIISNIQSLHNAVVVSSRGSFSDYFSYNSSYTTPTLYQAAYQKAASTFFGLPIVPDFAFKKDINGNLLPATQPNGQILSYTQYANNLANLRSQLQVQLSVLLSIDPSAVSDPNSLYSTTKAVLNDLPPMITGSPSARIAWTNAKLWALDRYDVQGSKDLAQVKPQAVIVTVGTNPNNVAGGFVKVLKTFIGLMAPISGQAGGYTVVNFVTHPKAYNMRAINPLDSNGNVVNPLGNGYLGSGANDASKAGLFQQHITLAITAAQSLNNTQTEQVRAVMLNFEQFYKSASALLSAISQIIQKMAQNIRPA